MTSLLFSDLWKEFYNSVPIVTKAHTTILKFFVLILLKGNKIFFLCIYYKERFDSYRGGGNFQYYIVNFTGNVKNSLCFQILEGQF